MDKQRLTFSAARPQEMRDNIHIVNCDAAMFYTLLPSDETVVAVFGKHQDKRTERAIRIVLTYLEHYPGARRIMVVTTENADDAKEVQVVRVPQIRVYKNGSESGVVVGVPTFESLHEHLG